VLTDFENGLFVKVIWDCQDGPRCPLLAVTCFISRVGHFTDICALSSYSQQEDSLFATMPPLCPIGSHSKVQSPKSVTGGLGAFTKVFLLPFALGQGVGPPSSCRVLGRVVPFRTALYHELCNFQCV